MYEDLHDGNWKKLQWFNGSFLLRTSMYVDLHDGNWKSYNDKMALFYWEHRCTLTCMMGIEEVTLIKWLFYNTYRSTFWKARCCYWRWKRETESQKSNNLPESQCVYRRVKELRRSDTKIAAATKTMALATELKVALSLSQLRVSVL